jgi:Glutamine amidotransferase domain
LTPKTRREVLEYLVTGLKRLEYRGYDSAGVAIDTDDSKGIVLIKQMGKVKMLEDAIAEQMLGHDIDTPVISHCGISHTRWATHGPPSELNSHPQRSDIENTFVVVHNGIITNYKDVKTFLEKRGYHFESETDTEIIAKLVHHLYMQHSSYSFRELVEAVILQLVSDNFLDWARAPFINCCATLFRKELLLWPSSRSITLANVSRHAAALPCSVASRRKRVWRRTIFRSCMAKVSRCVWRHAASFQSNCLQEFCSLRIVLDRRYFSLCLCFYISYHSCECLREQLEVLKRMFRVQFPGPINQPP